MSAKRVAIGFALSAAAAVMIQAQAGQPVNLGVDMGLWQLTTHTQVSGAVPPQLEERLQKMPPAQRARIQAAMKAAMADAQRERVLEECMTSQRLSNAFNSGPASAQCKSTMVRNTRTDFEYHKVCALQDGKGHTETARFHLLDRHHLSGTVDVAQTEGGHALKVHETIDGKWLAKSCGGVKDVQPVK